MQEQNKIKKQEFSKYQSNYSAGEKTLNELFMEVYQACLIDYIRSQEHEVLALYSWLSKIKTIYSMFSAVISKPHFYTTRIDICEEDLKNFSKKMVYFKQMKRDPIFPHHIFKNIEIIHFELNRDLVTNNISITTEKQSSKKYGDYLLGK